MQNKLQALRSMYFAEQSASIVNEEESLSTVEWDIDPIAGRSLQFRRRRLVSQEAANDPDSICQPDKTIITNKWRDRPVGHCRRRCNQWLGTGIDGLPPAEKKSFSLPWKR